MSRMNGSLCSNCSGRITGTAACPSPRNPGSGAGRSIRLMVLFIGRVSFCDDSVVAAAQRGAERSGDVSLLGFLGSSHAAEREERPQAALPEIEAQPDENPEHRLDDGRLADPKVGQNCAAHI